MITTVKSVSKSGQPNSLTYLTVAIDGACRLKPDVDPKAYAAGLLLPDSWSVLGGLAVIESQKDVLALAPV